MFQLVEGGRGTLRFVYAPLVLLGKVVMVMTTEKLALELRDVADRTQDCACTRSNMLHSSSHCTSIRE